MSDIRNLSVIEAMQIRIETLEQVNAMFQDLLMWMICENIKSGSLKRDGFDSFTLELHRHHPDCKAELDYLSDMVHSTLAEHRRHLPHR